MFRFADPEWLAALILMPFVALLLWIAARGRAAALARFADAELVERLTRTVDVRARRWKGALLVVVVGLLAVALARPQFGTRIETVRSVGQDIVVAVDLSRSMLAEDVAPSRLERARLAVLRLMERLDGDRIGLVAFAADAFVQSPLTTDYRAAALFLASMDPEMMPIQGTDLGEALRVAVDAFEEGGDRETVLILITDAEDHEASYGEILGQLSSAAGSVYLVLVGTSEGAPIPTFDAAGNRTGFFRDEDGTVVTTRVGEETVRLLRSEAGVAVVQIGAGSDFDDFVERVASGTGTELDAREVTQFEEQYQIFLALALLMLVAETMLPERRRRERAWAGRFE